MSRSSLQSAPRSAPAGRVTFGPDLRARLEAFALRMESARRRREGPGRATHLGAGEEWIGFRPYRPGDDVRQLDSSLLARLDRPFVRLTRREVSERWAVLVDCSASMGIGSPGKLQCAAELAAAALVLGLRRGAQVTLIAGKGVERPLTRRSDLASGLSFLEGLTAGGVAPLEDAMISVAVRRAGRVVGVGDLLSSAPGPLLEASRGGREIALIQVLAPHELSPELGPVRWTCPETGGELEVAVDDRLKATYERELNATIAGWRQQCAQHGVRFQATSSAGRFEDVMSDLFGGAP